MANHNKQIDKALEAPDPIRAVLNVSAARAREDRLRFWVLLVAAAILAFTCVLLVFRINDVNNLVKDGDAREKVADCRSKATTLITDGQVEWQDALTELQAQPLQVRIDVNSNANFLAKTGAAIDKQQRGIREREAC